MKLKTLATMAAAVGLLAMTAAVPAAQAQPGPDNGNAWVYRNGEWVWSPQLNVKNSQRYSELVRRDRAFRQARMREECGPITDPQLRQQCLDSFAQEGSGPAYGSSGANAGYGSSYGR